MVIIIFQMRTWRHSKVAVCLRSHGRATSSPGSWSGAGAVLLATLLSCLVPRQEADADTGAQKDCVGHIAQVQERLL